MKNCEIVIRHAVSSDLRYFTDVPPERTIKAMVVVMDAEPVCIAGVTLNGNFLEAFSDVKRGIVVPKRTIWRYAKILRDKIAEFKLPMVAIANPQIPNAGKFLESLGFTFMGEVENQKIYRI